MTIKNIKENKDINLNNVSLETLLSEIDRRKKVKIPELFNTLKETINDLNLLGVTIIAGGDESYKVIGIKMEEVDGEYELTTQEVER